MTVRFRIKTDLQELKSLVYDNVASVEQAKELLAYHQSLKNRKGQPYMPAGELVAEPEIINKKEAKNRPAVLGDF